MNRLESRWTAIKDALDAESRSQSWPEAASSLRIESYAFSGILSVFSPMHYEPNYAYPLFIWLHGPGQTECQLNQIMPQISLRNFVSVAPRAPQVSEGTRGYTWGDQGDHFSTAIDAVFAAAERAGRFRLNPDRVFLAGHGCGGTMAMRIGLAFPDQFAGVISLDGGLPQDGAPLARWKEARSLPLFFGRTNQSQQYPLDRAKQDLQLMHNAGLSYCLREFQAHESLAATALEETNRWMMKLITR
ncbi:Phospholipase/Carboxylesterase [Planctomycetales bacterium 10988]|nr:Phospholipase/Carboxylesterase [Planctomycetales bacterium 10988]